MTCRNAIIRRSDDRSKFITGISGPSNLQRKPVATARAVERTYVIRLLLFEAYVAYVFLRIRIGLCLLCVSLRFTDVLFVRLWIGLSKRTDFADHFSGPRRAVSPMCVSVCPDNNFSSR